MAFVPKPPADEDDGDDDGDDDGGGSGCFIATAAYGSYLEPHVITLRKFRDSFLLSSKLGSKFVQSYYRYSPPIADYITEHDGLKYIARIGLAPLVGFSWIALNYGMMFALVALVSLLAMITGGTYFILGIKDPK